jgi:hypothetical protein
VGKKVLEKIQASGKSLVIQAICVFLIIFVAADPMLEGESEIGDCTAAVAWQRQLTRTEERCFLCCPLSNNYIVIENRCLLCGPCVSVIMQTTRAGLSWR